ncbi:histidine biosynthesis bifunctional protein hisIE [Skeletonema marinoi]|uniref:Histidine biosynthesis bifunctional protein hisIE n=1 Tax=Skeletonema marinoi TaxID=267567 RepID=A0AAD8XUU0_9STRA|nr:histidine biosynthesis bifunctional protein hisIE [Skeletonema marinoi]
MVCLPYPTFLKSPTSSPDALSLSAVGRARIHPQADDKSYQQIVSKCIQQSQVPEDTKENKQTRKKYMKQGVQLASDFLSLQLNLDVSIVDVEIVLSATDMVESDGCLACCFLDAGCQYIVVQVQGEEGLTRALEAIEVSRLPRERIVLDYQLPPDQEFVQQVTDVSSQVGTICVKMSDGSCTDLLQKIATWEQKTKLAVEISNDTVQSTKLNELVSRVSKAMGEDKGSIALVDPTAEQLGLAFAACMKTDRNDGLYTTVVCTRSNEALGLVYSSKESIVAALQCGRGVYYSRSRNGLWRKGDTSGHYQTLHRIDVDCDGDALRFTVTQNGDDIKAFCHLNTLTCWENHVQRLVNAPAGSYTKRLFEDETLLRDKLVEEAQELSEPGSKQDVAGELADVLYFAMVRATKAGVSIDDAVMELDRRAKKVTRRQGDSKAFRIKAGEEILGKK